MFEVDEKIDPNIELNTSINLSIPSNSSDDGILMHNNFDISRKRVQTSIDTLVNQLN